ncbi:MAG TPA: phage tail protein, partial [Candidatus Rifleibacterium sp.]|nr:phage tail protein [Candidatus Rifleibacterium sp.]
AGIVAGIALMAFSGGAGAGLLGFLGTTQGTLGLGLALYFGGSLLMGNQKAPSIDAPRLQGAFENGYNWSPNQIRLQPGNPMPITLGTIRTSGQLIARRVWSAEFAGKQTQYLGLLLAAGEGPLDSITDIEINDTPIESIQGATYEVRLGTNHQNPVNIAGLGSTVEFQPFSSELPLSDSAWITKAQTEPGDKITLDFVFPAGLYAVDTSSGATVACRGTIRWQYREVGAGSWITGGTNTYAQQARRPFYFSINFTPPDKTKIYEFRAQNYSLKDFAATYGGGWTTATEMPGNYSVAISWVGLTVNTNYAQTYPGVALVAISLPATENLSGSMPKVSWKQTRATVNVWNPTTEAYEQQDAQNIAWMVYYLIHQCRSIRNLQTDLDEYTVFGEPKENLNYTEFAAWANFCNYEVSAGVRRCHGNLLVDSAEQMWPAIQKIATSGRAFIIQQAGVFKPVWDSTRAMSQIFTSGNIIDGSLSGSFLPERERASAIEVSFINEDNGYERDTLFVTSDDYSPANLDNPTQVYLPAITSPKIAYMWAKHALKKNKYLKRTQTLQADIDSIVSEIGDVVGVQSDITSWGTGGRVMGATT